MHLHTERGVGVQVGHSPLFSLLRDAVVIPLQLIRLGVLVIQKRLRHVRIEIHAAGVGLLRRLAVVGVHHVHGDKELQRITVDLPLLPGLLGLLHGPVRAGGDMLPIWQTGK